ncbi:DUF3253 domain-containing protein [Xylophilus sp. Kf1]|nr:DUF3253 domain-containing protein [Xylophilus sp. Kf1]
MGDRTSLPPGESAGGPVPESAPAAVVEAKIFELLAARKGGATICPSEVARALRADEAGWRGLMPQVREVAQSLAQAGRIIVTRGGVEVEATSRGGPVRLGLFLRD